MTGRWQEKDIETSLLLFNGHFAQMWEYFVYVPLFKEGKTRQKKQKQQNGLMKILCNTSPLPPDFHLM